MKRFLLAIVLLGSAAQALARMPEADVATRITGVTVYQQGAVVTRQGTATLPAGTTVVRLTGLARRIDPGSIRMGASNGVTIVAVTPGTSYTDTAYVDPRVTALRVRREALVDSVAFQQALLSAYRQEEKMLTSNQTIGGQNGLQVDHLKSAVDFFRVRFIEVKRRQMATTQRIEQLTKDLRTIDNQIRELTSSPEAQATGEVSVTLLAERAGRVDLTLHYLVPEAGWTAAYDVRVDDTNRPIRLDYRASVSQSSGEPWRDVRLVLSSGIPTEMGVQPDLEPLRAYFADRMRAMPMRARVVQGAPAVAVQSVEGRVTAADTGEPLPGVNVMVEGTSLQGVTDIEGRYKLSNLPPGSQWLLFTYVGFASVRTPIHSGRIDVGLHEETISADEVLVTGANPLMQAQSNTAFETSAAPEVTGVANVVSHDFEIALPYTIPSDGKPNLVQIGSFDLPAEYVHYAAPVQDRFAYLTGRVTGWEDLHLMPGEANLYLGGSYVGRTVIDPEQTLDTLSIALGRDRSVVVERRLVKERSSRQTLGSRASRTTSYRIDVRNTRPGPVRLTLEDQVPVSTDREIEVDQEIENGGALDEETGVIQWRLNLAPAAAQSVAFGYTMKYPKGREVIVR